MVTQYLIVIIIIIINRHLRWHHIESRWEVTSMGRRWPTICTAGVASGRARRFQTQTDKHERGARIFGNQSFHMKIVHWEKNLAGLMDHTLAATVAVSLGKTNSGDKNLP